MNARKPNDPRLEPRHSIAVVSRRTGITQLVLRAWERRYEAVVPQRTDTGRRRYTDADMDKLSLLALLTRNGHRIGDIADLGIEELKQLAVEIPVEAAAVASANRPPAEIGELMEQALQAVSDLDARGLEATLDRALVDISKPMLRNLLIAPLLEEIGNRWRDGKMRVAHEHMASNIVAAFLAAINARHQVAPGSPVLAVATPAGQRHELGALLAASYAYEVGWDVLYLGPNLPAEDLAAAVRIRGARAILLSLVFPHGDPATGAELRELRRLVGPQIPIIVGGQATRSYLTELVEMDARIVLESDDLEHTLSL